MVAKNLKDLFGIDLINEDRVRLAYYKVVEIKHNYNQAPSFRPSAGSFNA